MARIRLPGQIQIMRPQMRKTVEESLDDAIVVRRGLIISKRRLVIQILRRITKPHRHRLFDIQHIRHLIPAVRIPYQRCPVFQGSPWSMFRQESI